MCSVERAARPREAGQLEQQADLALVRALEHRRLGVEAEDLRGPPEVGLEDLSDVHSARHAERVEHDVDRTAVGKERHVLLGHDAGHDTLVAVASGHLVADRDLALLGEVDLHQLDHARRQFVGLQDAVDALFRLLLDAWPSPRWPASMIVRMRSFDLLVLDAERLEVDRARSVMLAQRRPSSASCPPESLPRPCPHLSASAIDLAVEQLDAARRRALR